MRKIQLRDSKGIVIIEEIRGIRKNCCTHLFLSTVFLKEGGFKQRQTFFHLSAGKNM